MDAAPFSLTAEVYDLLHDAAGKDYEGEAVEVHGQIRDRAPDATTLLDVACGTGRHLRHLRRWNEVAGADAASPDRYLGTAPGGSLCPQVSPR